MTDRELMQQAMDALEKHILEYETIEALRARLAQPEPETVGYLTNALGHEWVFSTKKINQYSQPLYTAPPQREWQGLTEQEHANIAVESGCASADWLFYGAAVERALREKNT